MYRLVLITIGLLMCFGKQDTAWSQHQPVGIPSIPKGVKVRGLDPQKAITDYTQTTWTTKQGMPALSVYVLCQTRDGYLWIGTAEGLVRFDGIRFTVFNKTNTPGLQSNSIKTAILEDRSGALWIGTLYGGLCRFKNGVFESYTTDSGLAHNIVQALMEDRDGSLWIGTQGGGLSHLRYDDNGKAVFTNYTTNNGLPDNSIYALAQDSSGMIWIGTNDKGLVSFRPNEQGHSVFTQYTTANGMSDNRVRSLLRDKDGSLWIGTVNGVNRMQKHEKGMPVFTPYTTKDGLSNNIILPLLQDRDGSLWIGTDGGGLHRMIRGKDGKVYFEHYTTRDGLPHDRVWALLQDREGALWIGVKGGGLNRLQNNIFSSYTRNHGLSNDIVRTVLQDRAGTMWLGTDAGIGQMRRDEFGNAKFTSYTASDGLLSDQIRAMLADNNGRIWIAPNVGGLSTIVKRPDGKITFKNFTSKNGLASDHVTSLLQDRNGTLWFGTDDKLGIIGGSKDSEITFTNYPFPDSLGPGRLRYQDSKGNIWTGFNEGLIKWSACGGGRDSVFRYTSKQGLSGNFIRSFWEDSEGVLWIGTIEGGLNRMKNGKITTFTINNGLFDNTAYSILEDQEGYFWMSCNRGVYRVRKQDLNDFADGKLQTIPCRVFGTADGMKSPDCSGSTQPSAWKSSDGTLWFPTAEGVIMVNPRDLYINPLPPPVIIEEIKADSAVLNLNAPAELPSGTDKFEFRYTAICLTASEKVRYKYLLEGYDKDWVDAGTRHIAYYTNLPRGQQYRFRVIACNNDGVWNEVGASAVFSLVPYFWETWWFYGICAIVLAGNIYGAYHWRTRRLRDRTEELERMVRERTEQLQESNNRLVGANEEIQRQMLNQAEQAREIELAHRQSEHLLLNILPLPIAERMKKGETRIAEHFSAVTVLFADVVGFTKLSAGVNPQGLVELLDALFSALDVLAAKHGLEKIKTIGDSYMVVSGIPVPLDDHCERMARFALEMQAALDEVRNQWVLEGKELGQNPIQMRVGIHTGEAVAGVIGTSKFAYDLWGDTVNTASRMESHGEAGEIHVTQEVYSLLKGKFVFEERGQMEIKDKGTMRTWFLVTTQPSQ